MTFGDSPGRTIASLVLAGLVAPAICWVLLGMPPEQALFVAAVAVTVAALVRFPPDGYDIGFPEPPDPVRDRGARREAFRLSWNVAGREDRVGATLINRLQQVAARRLVDHGLRLHHPADRDRVLALLDRTSCRVLTLPPGSDTSSRSFNHALTMVERLAELDRPAHHIIDPTVTTNPTNLEETG